MCYHISSYETRKCSKRKYMWKLFKVRNGKLYSMYYRSTTPFPVGKWVTAMFKPPPDAYHGTEVGPGVFHGFKLKKEAANKKYNTWWHNLVILRVEIDGFHSAGHYFGCVNIGARKIRIPTGAWNQKKQ